MEAKGINYDPVYYDLNEQAREAGNRPVYGMPAEEPEKDPLELKTLDQFTEKEPEWLIPVYIPRKQITLISGTGGTGKTSIWISLAASISSGSKNLFDGFNNPTTERFPHSVMFFSGEDTVENVLLKKLKEQGAELQNIITKDLSEDNFEEILFESEYLEKLIERYYPYLCIFDPLQNFINKKVKMADRNAMRQSMRSLIKLGETYGTTFIIVMHTNKQSNVYGRQRMADSADLWDIARSVLMIGDTTEEGIKISIT
ncbi:MAG: AAA family ATPase [Solobacterium sp.]|nr:AAA family ATPase [Solobacterium sp.]